jgi:hypothetical protein
MSFVVSANYRDRSSKYKWLVRREEDPIEKVVAFKEVRAEGVIFKPSSKLEEGFGCKLVAYCERVNLGGGERAHEFEMSQMGMSVEKLEFDGSQICKLIPIEKLQSLDLCNDGTMYGKFVSEVSDVE